MKQHSKSKETLIQESSYHTISIPDLSLPTFSQPCLNNLASDLDSNPHMGAE